MDGEVDPASQATAATSARQEARFDIGVDNELSKQPYHTGDNVQQYDEASTVR